MKDAFQKSTFSYASYLIKTNKKFQALNQTYIQVDIRSNEESLSLNSKSTLIDIDLTPPTELRASAVRAAGIEQMDWIR